MPESDHTFPFGKITTVAELGQAIRAKRRAIGLRQADLAALAGVGTRFLSDLENGKETAEFGRILRVLSRLGLELFLAPRGSALGERGR